MRTKSFIIMLILLTLPACGGGGGGGGSAPGPAVSACATTSALGRWETLPGPSDVLTLDSDCSGYMSYCAQRFTFTPPTGNVGTLSVTLLDMPGQAGCQAAGTYTCSINYNSTNMAINCGNGILNYTKAN